MARARNIKPGIFTNEDLAELPIEARFLFIGLWTMADREGRLEDRPKRIKMTIFPADAVEVEPMLTGLDDMGLIVRYQAEGMSYIWIPGFTKHQKPHPREAASTIPPYLGPEQATPRHDLGMTKVFASPAESLLSESPLSECSSTKKDTGCKQPERDPTDDLKLVYPKRAGSHRWQDAKSAINARIREGHTLDEIVDGARRYAAFCAADGIAGTKYVMQAATFVGANKEFLNAWEPPSEKPNGTARKPVYEQPHERREREFREHEARLARDAGLEAAPGDARGSVLPGVWSRAQ